MRHTLRHFRRRTSGALSGVAALAATLSVLGSLCVVVPALVRCQHLTKGPSARSECTVLRARGGYDELMGFGKHRSLTYDEVMSVDPRYCAWALRQKDKDSESCCAQLCAFAEHLQRVGFSTQHHGGNGMAGADKEGRRAHHSLICGADKEGSLAPPGSSWLWDPSVALKGNGMAGADKEGRRAHQGSCKWQFNLSVSVKVDLASYRRMESDDFNRVCKSDDRFKADFFDKTYHEILSQYVDQQVRQDAIELGVGWASVKYKQDPLGRRLVEEGLIKGARVYGGKDDPFHLPSFLNEVLTDKFYVNVDDSKAHPRYMRALTQLPEAKWVLDAFLASPEYWMEDIAVHYFSNKSPDSIKKVKVLILTLGMDGSVWAWRRQHKISESISEHPFVSKYAAVMPDITQEFAQFPEGKAAIALIKQEFPERKNPDRTWKSFLLQEIEFVSLQAKLAVANKYDGHGSIEHDGIKLRRGPKLRAVSEADLEAELTCAVTEAVHTHVQSKYGRNDAPVILPVLIKPASFKGG